MTIRFSVLLSTSVLLLSACSNLVEVEYEDSEPTEPASSSSVAPASEKPRETNNVSYEGVVQPAGISVYQEGSHRLVLTGGKFILLESNSVDLNGYVGESVQVTGALRPTVEAGGMIMRVDTIQLDQTASSQATEASSSSEESSSDSSEEESSAESSSEAASSEEESSSDEPSSEATDSSEATSSEDSSVPVSESSESSVEDTTESSVSSDDSESSTPSAEYQTRVESMAKQDFSAENWTQEYCTSHIGFCAPVHRNWWFKSFGATSSSLWHVELSSEPIENLGEGPIVIDLIDGSATSLDGTVDVSGGQAIGYREWTYGRHFRISADASLEAAVTYITENISSQEE